ncbi:hypothetical protein B7463_g11350, partial [Scytalidium lignicola]
MSELPVSSPSTIIRGWKGNTYEREVPGLLGRPEEHLGHGEFPTQAMSEDEQLLARLGYKQELNRGLGLFENWAATFSCMNFVSGMPILFGWVMMTGGPQAAVTSWTIVSIISCVLASSLAEIAAAFPTAGGIYFWTYLLGGPEWGPFLSWMTAWWNWSAWVLAVPGTQQGATNFLVSALQIKYPDAAILHEGWFSLLITLAGLVAALTPNITSPKQQASDAYCWVISFLFGAWEFGGYDASAHLAEETEDASKTVAGGMWLSTVSTTILSIPTLIMILFCIQNFEALISATYANNWAEFLVQVVGPRGAIAILVMNWIDCTCATAAVILSAQRVTFAISRDNILPGSSLFRQVSGVHSIPVNAALLVVFIAAAISCTVLGSSVAFSAITATTVTCQNMSYLFVLITRHTLGRSRFKPAPWNLGPLSRPVGYFCVLWIAFLSTILLLPQVFPVTLQTLNYSPVCLAIVTSVSVIGWFLPFGWGGRHWFKGPGKRQ